MDRIDRMPHTIFRDAGGAQRVDETCSTEELSEGNYWGWPKHFAMFDNYREALTTSPMLHYFWNSVLITVPSVVGSIALAAMAGFALAIYRFRGNSTLFATFVAGNFVPIQVLMIPVRDLSLQLGLFNTVSALISVSCVVSDRLLLAVSAQLHQAVAIRTGGGGAH
jgi:ABC-type glycerol-3-phosphate transport system permease component